MTSPSPSSSRALTPPPDYKSVNHSKSQRIQIEEECPSVLLPVSHSSNPLSRMLQGNENEDTPPSYEQCVGLPGVSNGETNETSAILDRGTNRNFLSLREPIKPCTLLEFLISGTICICYIVFFTMKFYNFKGTQ